MTGKQANGNFLMQACATTLLLLLLAFLSVVTFHTVVIPVVIILALFAYAGTSVIAPSRSVAGSMIPFLGAVLLIIFLAWQVLGPRWANPGNWETGPYLNNRLSCVSIPCQTPTPTPLPWWQFWGP